MYGRGQYRIRSAKRTEDDLDFDTEEHLKKKQSQQGFHRKLRQSSQNSRLKQSKLKESRTNSGFGSIVNSRCARVIRKSKNQHDKNVVTDIEFNNVRWISIVSAYDSKRLRHVTVSKQSCQSFLKKYGYGLKKDPAALAYFKDIKKHFHSWLAKINETFIMVLNHFLSNSEKSPLSDLERINPVLEQIRSDTAMMKSKLEGCLKHYESSDFRMMADRFKQFFSFSGRLEELICVIFEKKQKIDMLFYELERGQNIDRSLQKIRKEGIRQTKKLIYADKDHYNVDLCEKIMDKVGKAINDMASRGLNIFHKLQGAKQLIHRIKKILSDTNRRLTVKEIRTFSEIFQQILQQTGNFQLFVEQFDSENDFVTAELREKIHQCREDLVEKKRLVGQMQVIFVGTVISETIDLLSHSYSLNKAVNFPKNKYHEYNHLLEAIASAMLNQTKRSITQGLIKQNKIAFTRLEEDVDKIRSNFRRHDEGFIIDTEDGQVASMECNKLTKHYKDKIKTLVKKHEDALRNLEAKYTPTRLPSQDKDNQLIFLAELVSLTTTINNHERHDKMLQEKAFHQLKEGIAVSGSQLNSTNVILAELEESRKKIQELNDNNPLKELIVEISTENGLYLECQYLLSMMRVLPHTSENNLIESIGKVNDQSKKRKTQLQKISFYKPTKAYKHVVDRIFCQVIVKGLRKSTIKQLDDSKFLNFPESDSDQKHMENQVKYRSLICDTLSQEANLARSRLRSTINIMKDLISARSIIQKLKLNQNGQFVALTSIVSGFTSQMFRSCLIRPKKEGLSTQARKIVLQVIKCLKSKAMNIDILEGQLEIENNEALIRARKQFIQVKNINESAQNACEQLSKTQDNDPLVTLSKITHILAEYLHANKQPAYLALNQWRQPVWIGDVEQAKNGICSQIDLGGYPRGSFIDSYVHEPPRAYGEDKKKAVKTVSPKKQSGKEAGPKGSSRMVVRQKSHPIESMDQEIPAEQSDNNEMVEDFEDVAEEEMGEEMEEEMGEERGEMEEKYDDDMEEEIGQMGEDIQEMGEDIPSQPVQDVEQIGEDDIEIIKPSVKKVESPKKEAKVEEPKREDPKPVKKEILKPVYEVIPFFRELEQIQEMFDKIYLSEKMFWKENVDFQEIEDYYHREEDLKDRTNFIKSLENCFSMYLGSRFGAKLGEVVKNLDRLKSVKGSFMSLGEKNWNSLFKILAIIERNYSYLRTSQGQVLQLFVYNGDSAEFRRHTNKKCIHDYLERTFKTAFFSPQNFDYEGYISNCLKTEVEQLINEDGVSFHYVIKNTAKNNESLPEKDSDFKLKELKNLSVRFEDELETGINLSLTCLQFWVKAISSSSEDCYKPDYSTLDRYIKDLGMIEKKESIYHYLTELRASLVTLKSKIKTHKNNYDNLLFKVDSSNVLECIKDLAGLYSNAKITKLFLSKEQSQTLLFISRSEARGSGTQNELAYSLSTLFGKLQVSGSQNSVKIEMLIQEIQDLCKKDPKNSQNLTHFMQLLNILEIEHFYISKPQFLFRSNLEDLVLSILKPMGISKVVEFSYDELLNDLFNKKKKTYSNELTLKPNINHKLLSADSVKQTERKVAEVQKQVQQQGDSFRSKLKSTDMSSLLADYLQNKLKSNQLILSIEQYETQLQRYKEECSATLGNKKQNLLMYVHSHRASTEKIAAQINQRINQVSSLVVKPPKNKDIDSLLFSVDALFSELKIWAKAAGIARECTTYLLVADDKNYIINMQFSQSQNQRQKSKQYLEKMLARYWISDKNWSSTWNHLYEKYIDKQVKIEIGAGGISCIHYNLKAAVKKIMEDVRVDLAEKNDVVDYARHYNKYKFSHCGQSLQAMNKCHSQIAQRVNLKIQLLAVQKIVKNNQFAGLAEVPMVSSLLSCLKDQLDVKEDELQNIINLHNAIKGKDCNLARLSSWYKQLGQHMLDCHYLELYTAKETPITIIPMLKLEKDKAKNNEEIASQLKQINLESAFHLKLVQGVQRVYLQDSAVQCAMRDEEKYLNSNDQFIKFEPEIADGEMLLLVIQQIEGKQGIPLWISELAVTAKVDLILSEQRTTCQLSCGVWRIGKDDFENVKGQQMNNPMEENKALHKKVRGLASPEQKSKDVSIGQTVYFDVVGNWLKEELKKYNNKVEEKQKAEKERLRLIELQRKENTAFLESIEGELKRQNIPINHMTTEEIEAQKDKIDDYKLKEELKGYFRKIHEKTAKVIQKLEENKPMEEVSRLEPIRKTYLKALEMKLEEGYQVQLDVRDKAELQFAKILKNREKVKKQKRQAKKAETGEGNTLNIASNLEQEREDIDEEIKEMDVVELLMEREDITDPKVQQFLIEWLETEELKDPDYLRCLLAQFCSLPADRMKTMFELS